MSPSTTPKESAPGPRFVATVDGRRARLLRVEATSGGGERAEVENAIEEEWTEKEYGRPIVASRDGTRVSARKDATEERRARFARRVARWLEGEIDSRAGAGSVAVYCAPALYGAFRRVVPKRLAGRIVVHRRNVSNLKPSDVARDLAKARSKRRERRLET